MKCLDYYYVGEGGMWGRIFRGRDKKICATRQESVSALAHDMSPILLEKKRGGGWGGFLRKCLWKGSNLMSFRRGRESHHHWAKVGTKSFCLEFFFFLRFFLKKILLDFINFEAFKSRACVPDPKLELRNRGTRHPISIPPLFKTRTDSVQKVCGGGLAGF